MCLSRAPTVKLTHSTGAVRVEQSLADWMSRAVKLKELRIGKSGLGVEGARIIASAIVPTNDIELIVANEVRPRTA